jgi:hypothetical protein
MPVKYPGFGAECNGCGDCCRFSPCPLSKRHNLWINGACKALKQEEDRYWCDGLLNPQVYGIQEDENMRNVLVGGRVGCSYRAGNSPEEVREVLKIKPFASGSIENGIPIIRRVEGGIEYWPRQAVLYSSNGTATIVKQASADAEPIW